MKAPYIRLSSSENVCYKAVRCGMYNVHVCGNYAAMMSFRKLWQGHLDIFSQFLRK